MHSSNSSNLSSTSRYRYQSHNSSNSNNHHYSWLTYLLSLMASWKVMLPLILLVWFVFFTVVMSGDSHHNKHYSSVSTFSSQYHHINSNSHGNGGGSTVKRAMSSSSLVAGDTASSSSSSSSSSLSSLRGSRGSSSLSSRTSLRSIAAAQQQQSQLQPQPDTTSTTTSQSRVSNTDHNHRAKLHHSHTFKDINHLIIVAGHAVMRLNHLQDAETSDEGWYLLDYQKGQGYPQIITSHIQQGIALVKQDSSSILLFSGGQTRHDVGPLSEAASYYYLAEEKQWMTTTTTTATDTVSVSPSPPQQSSSSSLKERIYLEEYARDSFENLLFSICRYYELTNNYPEHITVIGFDFKQQRFHDLHRMAIHYPAKNFTYLGIPSPKPLFNQERATHGEEIVLNEFRNDLYGCHNEELANKRMLRNPFQRTIPYELACPTMRELLDWCGPQLIDAKFIPWYKS